MKNHIFSFIFAVAISLLSVPSIAQTAVPNGGFELWSGNLPTGWNSNSNGGGYAPSGPQTCFQENSNPHSGTYCVRIVSGSTFGVVVNGTATTGKVEAPSTTKSDGYIHTIPGDPSYSQPFTGRPDSIVGWYRYTPQSSDQGRIQVQLHVGAGSIPESGSYQGNNTADIVARAIFTSPASTVSSWTRFSAPFTYVDGRTPEYFLCVLTSSSDATGGYSGSILWVDDLSVIYNPALSTGSVNTGPYYVTAARGAAVSVPFILTGSVQAGNVVTAQLSDATGSFASPVNIGSAAATSSGTISATIPANTASGTGYRIRTIMNGPSLTGADNGADITVDLVNIGIAPNTAQTIAASTNGATLTLTDTPADSSQIWKYGTASGGPYNLNFSPSQTSTTYTPNFANPGTYYVVAIANYPGSVKVSSNEVQVNVVKSSIAPTSPQSLLVGVNGNPLTVTESPAGTAREWKYATNSGGPYSSFSVAETGTSYTPNFSTSGTYFVVCESQISGITATSNEVIISVGNATILTGTVHGSPFLFSPSAHNVSTQVPYTTSGTFNAGNVFTAQLSDSTGSFNNATNIGSTTSTGSGTIGNAIIQYTTPAGSGYRIRVVSSNPVVYGSDNGVDLVIDQFHNSMTPPDTQNIQYHTPGTTLTVSESQAASRTWQYSKFSGGPYRMFSPTDTGTSYTPMFDTLRPYYIIVVSKNHNNDYATSNEVVINILNGTILSTDSVSGSPYLVSPHAHAQATVSFSSNIIYNPGNTFQVQMSDDTGSFANPVVLGIDTSVTPSPITVSIPNITPAGSGYRMRVVSSDPATTSDDNGVDLQVIPFQLSVSPQDTQRITIGQQGVTLIATESQPSTRQWRYSGGVGYRPFSPAQTGTTYTPEFNIIARWYVQCQSVNAVNDTLVSQAVVVYVSDTPTGINAAAASGPVQAWWTDNTLMVDLRYMHTLKPALQLVNMLGQQVLTQPLVPATLNPVNAILPAGIYLFRVQDGDAIYDGKTLKK